MRDGNIDIVLEAVDDNGDRLSCLFAIMSDGTIRRSANINPKLGFQLDSKGRILNDDRILDVQSETEIGP